MSLAIALNIVMISSIPLVPLASACPSDMPEHASAMHAMDEHAIHTTVAKQAEVPAGQDCIECGCGCHDSVGSLPNLLAPHAPFAQDRAHVSPADAAIASVFSAVAAFVPLAASPPPRNV